MFLYKKIELLFFRKWELLFLKRTGILIIKVKWCDFSLDFSKKVYICFWMGEGGLIILHFITGLKLLIFPKVDKQLSKRSFNYCL